MQVNQERTSPELKETVAKILEPELPLNRDFEIRTKNDHTQKVGIYAVSKPVKKYKDVAHIVERMIPWLDTNNGRFETGDYKVAYAVSHCQVADEPHAFFVVHKEFLGNKKSKAGRNTYKNYFFPSRVIFNAEILEKPAKMTANVPKRELIKTPDGKQQLATTVKEGLVDNLISVPEACMSFPNRTKKNMQRYFRIKVRYQVPRSFLGVKYLKTITEYAEGLKAHIFQHEIDHAQGVNMYYGNGNKNN